MFSEVESKKKRERIKKRPCNRYLILSMFLVTFTTINRTTLCRFEWNFALFTTVSTSCLVHRSRATIPTSSITQLFSPLLTYTARTYAVAVGNKQPQYLLNFPFRPIWFDKQGYISGWVYARMHSQTSFNYLY